MSGTELLAKQDEVMLHQEKILEFLLGTLENYLGALKNMHQMVQVLITENHELKGTHAPARDRSVT